MFNLTNRTNDLTRNTNFGAGRLSDESARRRSIRSRPSAIPGRGSSPCARGSNRMPVHMSLKRFPVASAFRRKIPGDRPAHRGPLTLLTALARNNEPCGDCSDDHRMRAQAVREPAAAPAERPDQARRSPAVRTRRRRSRLSGRPSPPCGRRRPTTRPISTSAQQRRRRDVRAPVRVNDIAGDARASGEQPARVLIAGAT